MNLVKTGMTIILKTQTKTIEKESIIFMLPCDLPYINDSGGHISKANIISVSFMLRNGDNDWHRLIILL